MKAGRPKTTSSRPAKRTARSNDESTAALHDPDQLNARGRPRKTTSNKQPRSTPKRSLLAIILSDPKLTRADKTKIKQAYTDGLTVADLAAMAVYEVKLAQRLFEQKQLAAKDLVIALNKASSHIAAASQLAAAQPGSGGANINVTFNVADAPKSDRPEAAATGTPDPVVGDVIDAE